MVSMILTVVLKIGMEWFSSWWNGKQAAADKWNLAVTQAKLDSIVVGKEQEVKINAAVIAVKPIQTMSDFQAAMAKVLLACLLLFALTGCPSRLKIGGGSYKEEIAKPDQDPAMFQGPPELTEREKALMTHIVKQKTVIDEYNRGARESNIKNGYIPGVK